jgi:hypothetical protein
VLQRSCSAVQLLLLLGSLFTLLSPPLGSQAAPQDDSGRQVFEASAQIVVLDVLKYLKSLKPGRRMAIFTLGTQLRFIQGLRTIQPCWWRPSISKKMDRSIPRRCYRQTQKRPPTRKRWRP